MESEFLKRFGYIPRSKITGNEKRLSSFERYLKYRKIQPLKVWIDEYGYHALVNEPVGVKLFTQKYPTIHGQVIVRLSFNDCKNRLIVGNYQF